MKIIILALLSLLCTAIPVSAQNSGTDPLIALALC